MTALVTGRSEGNSLHGRQVYSLIFREQAYQSGGENGGHFVEALGSCHA